MSLSSDQRNQISRMVIVFIAILGCSIQLRTTLLSYFHYESVSRTIYKSPEIQEAMSLSVCISYVDILNYSSTKELSKVEKIDRDPNFRNVHDLLTVSDIFRYTPRNDSILRFCGYRFRSTREFTKSDNKTLCHELFKVKKYFSQEFMCYTIIPKQLEIPLMTYVTAIEYSRGMYGIGIENRLAAKITWIKLIVHGVESLPSWSKRYATTRQNLKANKTLYHMGFTRQFISYLGFPYDRFICSDHSEDECMLDCVNGKTIEKYNRVSYDLDTTKAYDYKHMSITQVRDPETAKSLDGIISECTKMCNEIICDTDFTITSYETDDNSAMEIVLYTPNAPDTLVKNYPSVDMLDLVVYVMGAIGAWFGFAFIQIDSMGIYSALQKLALRLRGKKEEENYILWRRVNVGTKGRPNIIHVPVSRLSN